MDLYGDVTEILGGIAITSVTRPAPGRMRIEFTGAPDTAHAIHSSPDLLSSPFTGPVTVLIPLRGISMIDAPAGPFWWPEANRALFDAIKGTLRPDIPLIEMDANVNDPEFARRCAEVLLESMRLG